MRQIEKKKTRPVTTQIEVPCPAWLQKNILKNLDKASKNRFWPDRAKKATEILRAISTENDTSKATMHSKPLATTVSTESEYLPKRVHTFASRTRNLVNNIVDKSINHLKSFTTKLFNRRKVGNTALSGA
jgi:hypothetical protein